MKRRQFLAASTALAASGFARRGDAADPLAGPLDASMKRARQGALDALKPSAKDLEHGLELHRRALVFDAYGFAPRAAMDLDALDRAAEAGATDRELEDLREEMGMTRCVTDPAERAAFLAAWEASGVTCIFQNAGEEGQDPLRLMKRLARFTYVTDMLRTQVAKAATPDDVLAAKKDGRHCLYLTGNGVPLAQNWNSVEDELSFVRLFFQMGIRMMHVTYNRRNMLGDGCAEPANAGLSDLGRHAVAEMNRVGVIVDVAHSGWRTSLEAAKASKAPMVASHTGCDAVHHHIRCKPDEVLRAIADTGGLAGVCCIPSFLGGGINAFLDHIQYLVRKLGPDHVAIGTDVAYSAPARPRTGARPAPSRRARTRYEAFWPKDSLPSMPKDQLTLSWTNWPLFTVGMVQRGLRDEDIEKILGRNILRVARDVLSASGNPR